MRAAVKADRVDKRERLWEAWIANNATSDEFKAIQQGLNITESEVQEPDAGNDVDKNWKEMITFFKGL